MNSSSFKLRKMSLVEYVLGIQDEQLFNSLETTIQDSLKKANIQPAAFTKEEVLQRAEISNQQIKEGKVLSQSDLEKQSENW
jgi:hypothetical protein